MDKNTDFRAGFVSITGRPNVGKSTFLNEMLGQKIAIVTDRPQTTRNRILGVKTMPEAQLVFLDTPGIHRAKHGLGALMVKEAKQAIKDVDVVLLMVDPHKPGHEDRAVLKLLMSVGKPVVLAINKADTVRKPMLLPVIQQYSELYEFKEIVPISALKGEGLETLLKVLVGLVPKGEMLYPEDVVTDSVERFMAAEFIREKVMRITDEEVPHSVAVEIVSWDERADGLVSISANIYVEKDGQKGIIIGKKGERLKAIGTSARTDIEGLLDTKVFLELWVKVKKDWRMKKAALSEMGFN